MTEPRIGVVGVGALGQHHARVARDLEGVHWSGVFDIDVPRREAIAADLGVEDRPSLAHLIEASDAIVIAVPTTAHEAVALDAIEMGRHVFIEKPLALALESADRIVEATQDALEAFDFTG